MAKTLLSGHAAAALGAHEADVRVVFYCPKTSSAEIAKSVARYGGARIEPMSDEGAACAAALGASMAGGRAMVCCNHAELSAMADGLFSAAHASARAGLVLCVVDDSGMGAAQGAVLEPSDADECRFFTKRAFELSEQLNQPVVVRLSACAAYSQSLVQESAPDDIPLDCTEDNGAEIGVICAGISYLSAHEALGDHVNYLKIGMVCPLPEQKIRAFAAKCRRLFVIEEAGSVIEDQCRALGVEVSGKSAFEGYAPALIAKAVLGKKPLWHPQLGEKIPERPPVMCPGCPHRAVLYALKKLELTVLGEFGCPLLGMAAPVSGGNDIIHTGAPVSAAQGMAAVRGNESGKKLISVVDAEAFIRSGVAGLIDAVCNKCANTIVVLDAEPDKKPVDLEALCRAVGVGRVVTADPFDLDAFEQSVKAAAECDAPSVVIARRPCARLSGARHGGYAISVDRCNACHECMKLACPALSLSEGAVTIDSARCSGCALCASVCPNGAIEKEERP